MLWLCIHLPSLPLDIYTRGKEHARVAIAEMRQGHRQRVLMANQAAMDAGIYPGMQLGAAYVLVKDLRVFAQSQDAEQNALRNIAAWSSQFTSLIYLLPPDSVLLEVGGSLRLFGGARQLTMRVYRGMLSLGYQPNLALAPTPTAAAIFARAGKQYGVIETARLPHELSEISLEALRLPEQQLSILQRMGLYSLGDCMRLPRAGLVRRLGPDLLLVLDKALGKVPDSMAPFIPARQFKSHQCLPGEIGNTQALWFVARRQLHELVGFLRGCCGGVQQLEWELRHRTEKSSHFALSLLNPTRDGAHLGILLRERLDRLCLPAPVTEIILRVKEISVQQERSYSLFPTAEYQGGENGEKLLETLSARLGATAIRRLGMAADHRPELAWCLAASAQPGTAQPGTSIDRKRRPLWLTESPLPLRINNGTLYYGVHRLSIAETCERIESGWWDEHYVRRDYHVATGADGERYWVYRDLATQGWFLHGIF